LDILSTAGKRRIFEKRTENADYAIFMSPDAELPEIYLKLSYGECGYLHQYSLKNDNGTFLLTTREQYDIDPYLLRNHKIYALVAGDDVRQSRQFLVDKIMDRMMEEKEGSVNLDEMEENLKKALAV
jgi:hypothetical protein